MDTFYKSNIEVPKNIAMQFKEIDINVASLYLNITIKNIYKFLQTITKISTKEVEEMMLHKQSIETTNEYTIFEDNTWITRFAGAPSYDWTMIMYFYILFSSTQLAEDMEKYIKFVKEKKLNIEYFHSVNLELKTRYLSAYNVIMNKPLRFEMFQLREFQKAFRRLNIDVVPVEKLLALTWKNISVGDDMTGKVNYQKIVVLLDKRFMIDRYILYFNNFYFNSIWNIPELGLHPNVTSAFIGYGRNNFLEYVNHNNYTMIAETLHQSITQYNAEYAIHSINDIQRNLQLLTIIWKDNQGIQNLKDRSKKVFTEASNVQKST